MPATKPRLAKNGTDWFRREASGIAAGDIFSVPLPGGGFGFGRVMNTKDGAMIAEFFRHWQADNTYSDAIPASGRLFSPIGIDISDIAYRNRKRPWQVIAKDPDYYPDDFYEIPFLLANVGNLGYGYFTYYDSFDQRYGSVSKEDVDNGRICSNMPQHPGMIEIEIEEQLARQGIHG